MSMSMKGWERNTGGLAAHAQRRKEVTSQRVEAAITTLLRANTPINFTTVSKEWSPRRAATIPRENRGAPRPSPVKMGVRCAMVEGGGAQSWSAFAWCCEPVKECDRGRVEYHHLCHEHVDETSFLHATGDPAPVYT